MATIILIPGRKESFANYSGAVEAAGGQVVFSEDPACLPAFDGLLLPGGGDVELGQIAALDLQHTVF